MKIIKRMQGERVDQVRIWDVDRIYYPQDKSSLFSRDLNVRISLQA